MVRKVTRGQALSIRAGDWNNLANMANAGASGAKSDGLPTLPFGMIWLKNGTATDYMAHDVVPIESLTRSPEQYNASVIRVSKEDAVHTISTNRWGRVAALTEPIPAGQIGRAVVSGRAVVRVKSLAANSNLEYFCYGYLTASHGGVLTSSTSGPVRLLVKANTNTSLVPAIINCPQPIWKCKITGQFTGTLNQAVAADLYFLIGSITNDGVTPESVNVVNIGGSIVPSAGSWGLCAQGEGGTFFLLSNESCVLHWKCGLTGFSAFNAGTGQMASQLCAVQYSDATGLLTPAGFNATIWNAGTTAIPAGSYGLASLNHRGMLIAINPNW